MVLNRFIAIIGSLFLVFSHSVVAEEYYSIEQVQKLLFSNATDFIEDFKVISQQQKKRIKQHSGMRQRWDEQKIWRVKSLDKDIGWFIIDDVVGKHEFITYALGLTMEGRVKGVEIMTYRETHGSEVREETWRKQFIDMQLGDNFKLDQGIDSISGATLSVRNVTDGIHRLLALHTVVLAKSSSE